MPSPNSGDATGVRGDAPGGPYRGEAATGSGAGTGGSAGGEFAVIERLQRHLPGPPAGETWIGDDAAVLDPFPGPLLFTTDMSVGGVHADLDVMGLDDLGWRAVAAAVSDIAAMGGRAHHVLVAVAGPPSTDIDRLYQGVAGAARAQATGTPADERIEYAASLTDPPL